IGGNVPAATVTFYVGGQSMGTVPLVAGGGVVTGTLSAALLETVAGQMAPGPHTVTAGFGGVNSNFAVSSPTQTTLTIAQADSKTGTASYSWNVDIGNNDSQSYTIGVIVTGYYTRNSQTDDTVVTVKKPTAGSIGGGGFLVNSASYGTYAGTAGLRTNFGLN